MIKKAIAIIKFIVIGFFVFNTTLIGQSLNLSASFGGVPVELDKTIILKENDVSLRVSKIKFYFSDLHFFQNNDHLVTQKKEARLIDLTSPVKLKLSDKITACDRMDFLLGVDSTNNVSGAMDGDLDPLAGMYWTWQSGYINFKIEGLLKLKDSAEFDIICHLGGFRYPFISAQRVSLLSMTAQKEINLNLELDEFISEMIKRRKFHVMSPGKDAVEYSEIIAHSFKFKY